VQSLARWILCWRRSRALSHLSGVIAVSNYVGHELTRSKRVKDARIRIIPNLVDLPSVDGALRRAWPLADIDADGQFLLFAGKLDINKGPQLLPDALKRSGVELPVAIAGTGPLRDQIQKDAARSGLDFRFYDWLDNDDVLLLMSRATVLLFPSAWQEPLSRVLLEGSAAGAAIVAMNTGGTSDVISHYESGWLAANGVDFAEGIRLVAGDPLLNRRLRVGARQVAETRFASPIVAGYVEDLYGELLDRRTERIS
jgi:glycosyltransferase involved in cell wall biosynthesis